MKRFGAISIAVLTIVVLIVGMAAPVSATGNNTETQLPAPIVVYGETLSQSQKEEVSSLLKVNTHEQIKEYTVTGEDLAEYINGDPNSGMYSSAKIIPQQKGKGLTIDIVTPANITQVSSEMYANALLTAGVENAKVFVASPVKVTGHSALSGIYKAYDAEGKQLDKERMILANDELDVATDLAGKEGLSQEEVSRLLTEIKKAIAEQNPATKEEVEQIVKEQLNALGISLSESDRQMLIDLFNRMRNLNIDFNQVQSQLEDIAAKVEDKLGEIVNDEGFWNKVQDFINNLLNLLKGLFS
ncbi:DUF1002 domain-containing protein [Virgibacillus kekensis]|uniref:DUF1002 domain-containing protein n=1 Tax=Virgibacillus kekensis TaxID=202261 RepID=A0ABV9DHC3_9BACI